MGTSKPGIRTEIILHFLPGRADVGGPVLALSPTDFGKLIADETEKRGKVIRAANIKPQ